MFYVESDKKLIFNNLNTKNDLLIIYAKIWQWRYIYKNADC